MLRDQRLVGLVSILLPAGFTANFQLHGQRFSPNQASCFVIKDAGDDPDITNGAEIHVRLSLAPAMQPGETLRIVGGTGIGQVTKPGLAVAPGEWAINPVPRKMIMEAVRETLPYDCLEVEVAIPDGEQRALKTLNARLGIMGGLSILGTTGVVRPISAKAWTDTIDTALDVARASGCHTVVFSTGRTSELAAQQLFSARSADSGDQNEALKMQGPGDSLSLPEESYIMMGDHVAHALRSARSRGFHEPLIACQFAKLVKIACGYANTHAAASDMDLSLLRQWAAAASLPPDLLAAITKANTAREIALNSQFDPAFMSVVAGVAFQAVQSHTPGITPRFLLADYSGRIVFRSTPSTSGL